MNEKRLTLAVPPDTRRFAAHGNGPGEEELVAVLQAQRNTSPVPIEKVEDVLLDDKGRVQGQFRLTEIALSQLCAVLAPGLIAVLNSVSGIAKRKNRSEYEKYSTPSAIRLLNQVIHVRFGLLEKRFRFILDRRSKQIEGVVGPKYHFFSNLAMYERVADFLKTSGGKPTSFYEASLSGRRLQLRYRIEDTAFAVRVHQARIEHFYGGWHFSNSELGDCCVKGSCVLIRHLSNTYSLIPYGDKAKVVHVQGGHFDQKLRDAFASVKERIGKVPNLRQPVQNLLRTSANLGGSPEDYAKRRKELISLLRKRGIYRPQAIEAVRRATLYGSHVSEQLPGVYDDHQDLASFPPSIYNSLTARTMFDLYNALGYVARYSSLEVQELTEQAAYRLLLQKFATGEENDKG